MGGDTTWVADIEEGGPPLVVRGLRGGYVTEATPDGVLDLRAGDEKVMRLPEGVSVFGTLWEDTTSLLVQAGPESSDGDEAWVRCYGGSCDCELARTLGSSWGVARR